MTSADQPTLSICMRCRDRREASYSDVRGGTRLAQSILARADDLPVKLRGVNCLSQCKRSCAIALSGAGRFTYVFGDLDPEAADHIDAVVDVSRLYTETPDGLMMREDRPAPLKTGILGRVPPLGATSDLIVPLTSLAAE